MRDPSTRPDALADRIVDTSLEIAEERGWENVRLHDVADRLGIPLTAIAARHRDLDAVADAWFRRGRDAMLARANATVAGLSPPERLHTVIMAWFDALAPHREVTGEMIRSKLWPSHPHHWVPMIFALSRLVHWQLDAARIRSTGRRRQLAESGLTLIFLATLRDWLGDHSPDQLRTRAHLRRRLEAADRLLSRRPLRARPRARQDAAAA